MPTSQNWPRWMAASGILFGILFVIGMLMMNLPDGTDAQVTAFYTDSGNRMQLLVDAYVLVVAAVVFLVYVVDLRSRMRAASNADSPWVQLSFISGVVFAAALILFACMIGSIAGAQAFGDEPVPTAAVARFLPESGYAILMVGGAFMVATHIASAGAEALRNGLLPRWLCVLGFVLAFVVLFSVVFIPLIAIPLWTIITGVILLRAKGERATATATRRATA